MIIIERFRKIRKEKYAVNMIVDEVESQETFFYPICYDVPSHDQSSAASLPKDPKDLVKLLPIVSTVLALN